MTRIEIAADALRRHEHQRVTRSWHELDKQTRAIWIDKVQVVLNGLGLRVVTRDTHAKP